MKSQYLDILIIKEEKVQANTNLLLKYYWFQLSVQQWLTDIQKKISYQDITG